MIFPGIKKLSHELNFYKSKSQTFGFYENYFVRLGDGAGMKYAVIEFEEIEESGLDGLKQAVMQHQRDYGFRKADVFKNSIYYEFPEPIKSFSVKKIRQVIDDTLKLLKGMGIQGNKKCHHCNESHEIEIYHFQNNGVKLCPRCLEKFKIELAFQKENYLHEDKKYLKGLLSVLFFGLGGVILGVILYVLLNRIATLSAIVTIFLGIWGYKKSGAKPGRLTIVVVLAPAVLYTILGYFTGVILLLMKSGNSFNSVIQQMMTNEKLIDVMQRELLLVLMFSLFVIIPFSFSLIRASIFPKLKEVEKV